MVVGAVLAFAIPAVAQFILQTELARSQRNVVRLLPGSLVESVRAIQQIQSQGRVPVSTINPFTGGIAISAADQSADLFNLLGERFARDTLRETAAESAAIFTATQELIEARRTTPVFPQTLSPDPTEREVVVEALSRSVATLVAPGVVERKTSRLATPRRLGGPCAGANTGFSRLNCARGGFA